MCSDCVLVDGNALPTQVIGDLHGDLAASNSRVISVSFHCDADEQLLMRALPPFYSGELVRKL